MTSAGAIQSGICAYKRRKYGATLLSPLPGLGRVFTHDPALRFAAGGASARATATAVQRQVALFIEKYVFFGLLQLPHSGLHYGLYTNSPIGAWGYIIDFCNYLIFA